VAPARVAPRRPLALVGAAAGPWAAFVHGDRIRKVTVSPWRASGTLVASMRFDELPMLRGATLLGHRDEIRRDRVAFFLRLAREGDDMGRLRILHLSAGYANAPRPLREILLEKARAFEKSPIFRAVLYPLAGDGLFASEGDLWRRQRKLMAPLFVPERLAEYTESMAASADAVAARWPDGEVVDVAHETTRITMDIAGRTLFGAETLGESDALGAALTTALAWADEQASSLTMIAQMRLRDGLEGLAERGGPVGAAAGRAVDALRAPILWPGRRSRELEAALATLEGKVTRMIAERRAVGLARPDLLSRLLQAQDDDGSRMTDKQVRDEVLTLFVAGHETTATGLAWALYLLARHPDAYARAEAEVDALDGRLPGYSDLPLLPYTLRVFKEALRLYPPVFFFGRRAIADVEIAGATLPKGTVVFVSPFALHRRADLWPDPDRFDPDRFTPEAEEARPRQSFLAFSAGPRQCIGNHFALMEGPLVLATLLQRARLTLASDRPVEPMAAGTLRPRGGVPMRVARRSCARVAPGPPRV
jgi:cytochrome P450